MPMSIVVGVLDLVAASVISGGSPGCADAMHDWKIVDAEIGAVHDVTLCIVGIPVTRKVLAGDHWFSVKTEILYFYSVPTFVVASVPSRVTLEQRRILVWIKVRLRSDMAQIIIYCAPFGVALLVADACAIRCKVNFTGHISQLVM